MASWFPAWSRFWPYCGQASPPAPRSSSQRASPGQQRRASGGGSTADDPVTTVRHVDKVTEPAPAPPWWASAVSRQPDRPPPAVAAARRATTTPRIRPRPPGRNAWRSGCRCMGGEGVLQSPTVGRFVATGVADTCFYVDVPRAASRPGTSSPGPANPDAGLAPRLNISEYGRPRARSGTRSSAFDCVGVGGKCDRRRRGRPGPDV